MIRAIGMVNWRMKQIANSRTQSEGPNNDVPPLLAARAGWGGLGGLAPPAINAYNAINDCSEEPMASITIRRLDDALKSRLRIRAAVHGRSMEDEAREILRATLAREPSHQRDLAEAIRARFAPFGGADLPVPEREPLRE